MALCIVRWIFKTSHGESSCQLCCRSFVRSFKRENKEGWVNTCFCSLYLFFLFSFFPFFCSKGKKEKEEKRKRTFYPRTLWSPRDLLTWYCAFMCWTNGRLVWTDLFIWLVGEWEKRVKKSKTSDPSLSLILSFFLFQCAIWQKIKKRRVKFVLCSWFWFQWNLHHDLLPRGFTIFLYWIWRW